MDGFATKKEHDGPACFVPVRFSKERETAHRKELLLMSDESWKIWLAWFTALGHGAHHIQQGLSGNCGHIHDHILDIDLGICIDCAREAKKWQERACEIRDQLPTAKEGRLRLVL